MESFYAAPFALLRTPNVKAKAPTIEHPSPMTVFAFLFFSYWLVTAGIIYDVITETPSVGSTTDDNGNVRPVAFMQYRINGQFIIEGISSAFMFGVGALGFILLDR